ncbi:beta-galactosidase [Cohnella fermenti]|uniref:beta-galactosidase n=1 Tax=Cohnella fermenti TaxID=2565925 RepID=A0A4S4BQQ6_9BACL|nr:alpha-amylase family protein [Cohnella fermenti]THF74948.1 hypothetical protein E6C55_23685 [Cohnella fermenti]
MKQADLEWVPFGFQYYRSPTPFREHWEPDLRRIAEQGFNCVKLWVQWRASQPAPDTFRFDDIVELMDIAHRNGLRVVLNVIFDVAPAWFYKRYPDSVMVTENGVRLEPRAINCRQIGGAPGPCYHHPEGQAEKDRFLQAAVAALRDHPALWVWDLWNEPELTTSIKRELAFENQVCYCDRTLARFADWLKEKYGTLDALNGKWQRTYRAWQEVEPPRGKAVFNDMVDWRLFMSDALTDDLRTRVSIVRAMDAEHPVMAHTVPGPIFNLITAGSDDFRLAETCDLFGNSLGSSAWSADLLLSAAKGKKVINSEIHALPGDTALKPRKLEWTELKKHLLIPLARGITGYLFWQYRPEVLGHEAPAWGSTYLDGGETPWLRGMAKLNRTIQGHRTELANGRRPSDRIAIFYGAANQIANFAAYGHLDTYFESVQGAHKLLHDLNYKVEFIHDKDMTLDQLRRYRCLWMPYPLYLSRELAETIRRWVAEGGALLSENSFGALQAEDGTHSIRVPGYGFDEVFGVRETWTHSVQHLEHSYAAATISSAAAIPISGQGFALSGAYYKTDIECAEGTETLASFDSDGMAAITLASYGQGRAVWIGTLLASAYWRDNGDSSGEETRWFFRELLTKRLELAPYVGVTGDGVRADVLEADTEQGKAAHLFVHAWGATAAQGKSEATIELPAGYETIEPWYAEEGGAELVSVRIGDEATGEGAGESPRTRIRMRIEPGDIRAYRLS